MPKPSSKSGKSSKTARVLNLLTDPESVDEAAPQPAAPESAAESAKLADDRRTQAKIRGALEMELAESVASAPARPVRARPTKAPSAPAAPVAPRPAPSARAAVPAEMPVFAEEPEVAAPQPAPALEPVFRAPAPPQAPLQAAVNELRTAGENDPDEYICFNVTQALVEDKADKYIKMFGLCNCSRCRIDVIALALSNLPAKYVVAKPHELIPRLSMYEQKYNAAVVTQVMSACRKVLDRPHHEREKAQ